mmetsp:Transcript_18284/g.29120  ORF Transcript_18284/g.29120 Transcript_18284/m.29120 type:complete len:377 (-) Transcript_18284:142-1272(-)
MLRQDVDVVLVLLTFGEQLDLRQHLVGEACRHHKRRVTGGVAKIQQTAFRQQDHAIAGWHLDHVHLLFDVGPLVVLQVRHLNFIVEVANVADNRHVLHLAHMLDADHVLVAGGGDKDVSAADHVFKQDNLEPIHGRLQGTDRVNFGDLDAGTGTGERSRRPFAHIAIAHDNGNLARHHSVSGAANAVNERFLTAVFVVEFRLGDRIVHIDCREGQLAVLEQIIKAVDTGRGFLGNTDNLVPHLGEPTGAGFHTLLDLCLDRDFFFGLGNSDDLFPRFGTCTEQDIKRCVATIVEDQVGTFLKHEGFVEVVPMLFQALALDRKNRRAAGRNRRCRVVLGGEDIARGPAHIRAQRHKRLDQNSGLDRHVQRADNARAR